MPEVRAMFVGFSLAIGVALLAAGITTSCTASYPPDLIQAETCPEGYYWHPVYRRCLPKNFVVH